MTQRKRVLISFLVTVAIVLGVVLIPLQTSALNDIGSAPSAGERAPVGYGWSGGAAPWLPLGLDVDLYGSLTSWDASGGVVHDDVDTTSPDGNVNVHISAGTRALDAGGMPLTEITVTPVDPLPTPPEGYYVIAAFDFEPDGATFDLGIEITVAYDPDALPEGADESNVVIAYRDADGVWHFVTGVVDTDANTVTFTIDHFTVFALMITAPTPELTNEATFSSAGGTMTTTDGRITLNFASGAFTTDTLVTVRSIPCGAAPSGYLMGETCFRIRATVDGEPVVELGATMSLCVEYSSADLAAADGDPNRLNLVYYDESASDWVVLDTTVSGGSLCAATNHLSDWSVIVAPAPAGLLWWHYLLIGLGALAVIAVIVWLAVIRPRRWGTFG